MRRPPALQDISHRFVIRFIAVPSPHWSIGETGRGGWCGDRGGTIGGESEEADDQQPEYTRQTEHPDGAFAQFASGDKEQYAYSPHVAQTAGTVLQSTDEALGAAGGTADGMAEGMSEGEADGADDGAAGGGSRGDEAANGGGGGGGEGSGLAAVDASGSEGDSGGSGRGSGLEKDGNVPVSVKGATTFPVFPLTENRSVSSSGTVTLPVTNSKRSVSPSASAYSVIWNIDLLTCGPNGGMDGVSCRPRTTVPTKATNVPEDWSTALNVTSAVTDIVLA